MKTILKTIVATLSLTGAAAVAYVYSGLYDVSASTPHSGLANWAMSTTMRASIERRAGDIPVPNVNDDALIRAGVNDFEAMCVDCHGAPGKARGPVGKGLNPQAPDLREAAQQRTPAELFWATKHGIKMTGMPAWGATHDDESLWPVVALMVALPELDAKSYGELLASAEGHGHHSNDNTEGSAMPHDHGETANEHVDEAIDERAKKEPEHDHSTHDH
ncbi:MAG: cytochrome c [Gammaproteobacteria bacterium]|nr:cytochrome c [Gammaproteobacteria bacterium]